MGDYGQLKSEQAKNNNYIKLGEGDDDDYHKLINSSTRLIVVDFSAHWCGPCTMIGPQFKKMSDEFADCIFIKVDVDELDELAESAGVKYMPTFHFYKNGKKIEELSGANPDKLRESIVRNLEK